MTNLPIIGAFSITAVYGQKGSYWANGHKGIDIVSDDKRIFATCQGTVRTIAYDPSGWGQYVSIGDAEGRRHIFCHLVRGSVTVKVGDTVDRNTVIGTMGATGNVTGVHLHFQLQNGDDVVDPTPYLGIPNRVGNYNSKDYPMEEVNRHVYVDEHEIAPWAKDSVQKVTEMGIMLGDDLGKFNPTSPVTRQELAVVMERLLKL